MTKWTRNVDFFKYLLHFFIFVVLYFLESLTSFSNIFGIYTSTFILKNTCDSTVPSYKILVLAKLQSVNSSISPKSCPSPEFWPFPVKQYHLNTAFSRSLFIPLLLHKVHLEINT